MLQKKKIAVCIACFCLVLSVATCFASNASGETAFITAMQEQVNADSLWGALIPLAGFIGFMVVFAFAYRILNKVLKKTPKGKAGI